MMRLKLFDSVDAGEAVGIRASPLVQTEHSPSFKPARMFISDAHSFHVLRPPDPVARCACANSSFSPNEAVLNSSVFPMSSRPKPREAELNFEAAMERLEKIVEQMESGKLPLEDLIVRYEEGMKLVKTCQERLASAEQKIEILTRDNAGKTIVQRFDPAKEAEASQEARVESESTDDEIKLF
jgi:exodeoxyribonuclease VII small subunit